MTASVALPLVTSSHPSESREDSLIAQAQASIDRLLAEPPSESESAEDAIVLDRLAAALEVLGNLNVGLLPDGQGTSDAPLKLGRFEVREERGRGGFGIVLRAFDPLLQREVALKLPHPERLIAGHSPEEFVREAQTAARLQHPGIVRVYEAGRLGPVWYIASAYCDGPTLAAWLDQREAPIPPSQAATLLAHVADAVHYAHSRGVLHLDLKPENILLEFSDQDEPSNPMVTDFGLAALSDAANPRRSSRIAGTWAYMAPEQRTGDAAKIGVTADVYALGAILYELSSAAAGRHAVPNDELVAKNQPQRPHVQGTPRDLEAVYRKCLSDDPNERYQTARDLGVDLEKFLRGEAVNARTPHVPERIYRWARRRPAVAALVVLLIATTATSMAIVTTYWRRAEANLAQLRAEQANHAQTSDRMRRSLLNFTWLAQENRLKPRPVDADADVELAVLRSFYDDLQRWTRSNASDTTLDAALKAAGHSLALADGMTQFDQGRLDQEFLAGLAAWQSLIALRPSEPQWRRALALHVFTYAGRLKPPMWLWWQRAGKGAPMDFAQIELVAEPYANLLVDFAGKRAGFEDVALSYHMFRAAIELLEDRRDAPDANGERLRTLLIAYNQLAKTAQSMSRTKPSQDAAAKAQAVVASLPPPAECSPLLALAAADTLRYRASELERGDDKRAALRLLRRAVSYREQAVIAFPSEPAVRLALVALKNRTAEVHRQLGEIEEAASHYRGSLALLDAGLFCDPKHRTLRRRRAMVGYLLTLQLLAMGDEIGARPVAEQAAHDFNATKLRKEDSPTLWFRAIRCWQVLGDLHADEGRVDDAAEAYGQSMALLEQLKTRRGRTPQYLSVFARSLNSLAELENRRPALAERSQ